MTHFYHFNFLKEVVNQSNSIIKSQQISKEPKKCQLTC